MLAGELDLGRVGLIDRVAERVLLLFQLPCAAALPSVSWRVRPFDAAIDFGDLLRDRFQFRSTREQTHGGRQRAGAERAVGFEHFAGMGDIALALRAGAMQIGGVGERIDDDGVAEKMIARATASSGSKRTRSIARRMPLRVLVPVVIRGMGFQPVLSLDRADLSCDCSAAWQPVPLG